MRAIKVVKENMTVIMKDSIPIVTGQDREMMTHDRPKPFVQELKEHLGGFYVNTGDGYKFYTSWGLRENYSYAVPKDETQWFEVKPGRTIA